jgi:ribosomal protein S18 acetylase RimI-like enzyme
MGDLRYCVRPAVDGDRAGILELGPRLAEGVAPWRDQAEALLAGRRWLEDSLAAVSAGNGAVLVAADERGIAGVITIRPSTHFTGERDGYIGELAVAERASRRGIGRALIDAADGWAREHRLRNLTLHTGAFNAGARAFYAALGFAEEEVRLTRPLPPPELPAPARQPATRKNRHSRPGATVPSAPLGSFWPSQIRTWHVGCGAAAPRRPSSDNSKRLRQKPIRQKPIRQKPIRQKPIREVPPASCRSPRPR